MRAVVQRVSESSVRVGEKTIGEIGQGLLILLGVEVEDSEPDADYIAKKVGGLRIFNDDAGKFNRSLLDVGGEALVVSQFTLYADARKGRRPSFSGAARPDLAAPLCDHFARKLSDLGVVKVATGQFGAMMAVDIHNDGPVTLWLDSDEPRQ